MFKLPTLLTIIIATLVSPGGADIIGVGIFGGSVLYDGDFAAASSFTCEPGSPVALGGIVELALVRALPIRFGASYTVDHNVTTLYNNQSAGIKFRDFSLDLSLMYRFFDPPLSPVSIYIGGGGGLKIISTDPVGSSNPSGFEQVMLNNDILWKVAGVGGIEIEIPAMSLSFFMDARLNYVYREGDQLRYPGYFTGVFYHFL